VCMRRDRWWIAIIGALVLLIGLASWHVTQMFVQLWIGALALAAIFHGAIALPKRTFTAYAITLVLASLLLPELRAKWYIVSAPMMIKCLSAKSSSLRSFAATIRVSI